MTQFFYYPLAKAHFAEGTVIVIDVLRAFTTAAYAFHRGAKKIYPLSEVQEALELRKRMPGALVMGEVDGFKPEGFDLGNSPAEVNRMDLTGRVMIQRTSAGTQGLVRAQSADRLLAASFIVASATVAALKEWRPATISFIITGKHKGRDGDEDLACGEFIQALFEEKAPNPDEYTQRVMDSSVGQFFLKGDISYFGREDLALSLMVDAVDFFLPVMCKNNRLLMEKGVI